MTWHAVAQVRDLRRPKRLVVNDSALVLWQGEGKVHAVADRCPHRMARLSEGRVEAGLIACPYHGWQFDGTGRCRAIPGHTGPLPVVQVRRWLVATVQGVVFVSDTPSEAPPYLHGLPDANPVLRLVQSRTAGSVLDVAENILDATHTHFTHRGILRGLGSRRYAVRVDVTGGSDWIEARYTGEARQHGLISALLESDRSYSIGRFRAPGIAELEFWGPSGLRLSTTFHLRADGPGHTAGLGVLAGPRQGGLGHLKALLFTPLFRVALGQDRRILAQCAENTPPGAMPVVGPLDFLRNDIARILSGKPPLAATTPRTHQITL